VLGDAIGVLVHPRRDSRDLLSIIVEWATGHGKTVRALREAEAQMPAGVELVEGELLAADAALVIAAGGDGTILRGLSLAHPHSVPVLGVNLGRLAFLAEVQYDDLAASLDSIDRGDYRLEERMTMAVLCGETARFEPRLAFNDAALTRVAGNGPAALAVEVEGEVFARYTADALVMATPTGSTGYSFSAGGPLVSPRHRGLLVTPVAPHTAFDRAVFLHPEERLRVHVLERSAPMLLEVDGQRSAELRQGDSIELRVGARPAHVMRLHPEGFYERARRKLQLVDSSELAPRAHPEAV
jgi:NAD+ kinase